MTKQEHFEPATVFCRSEKILDTDLDDEIVMMDIDNGQYYNLTDVGANIWRQLETPKSFGELIATTQQTFEVDSKTCNDEVSAFLSSLLEMKVVKQV